MLRKKSPTPSGAKLSAKLEEIIELLIKYNVFVAKLCVTASMLLAAKLTQMKYPFP